MVFPLLFLPLLFPLLLPLWHFLSFLKYIFTDVPPTSLMGSAVSVVELAGTNSVQHGASPDLLLQRPPCRVSVAVQGQE